MIEIHQNHPTFHHVNSPPKMPVQNAGKVHFEYQNTLHNVKGTAKYSNSTFLAWVISMLITSCFCMYNYNAVSGEAAITTGHAVQVFNVCIVGLLA